MRGRAIVAVTAVTAVAAGLGGAAPPAGAGTGRLADVGLALTSRSPDSPTGMAVHVLLHAANDPQAKPPAVRSAVFRGPNGLRFDTTAVPECTASDAQITVLGSNACPSDSRLTIGRLTAITGFGPPLDPFVGDDHVFDGPGQVIEVITFHGSSLSLGFDRLTISGSTLTAHPPAPPGGPPDGQTAIRSIDFAIPVRVAGGRSLITTPPDCPPGGQWTSTVHFGFANGDTDTVSAATPCSQAIDGG